MAWHGIRNLRESWYWCVSDRMFRTKSHFMSRKNHGKHVFVGHTCSQYLVPIINLRQVTLIIFTYTCVFDTQVCVDIGHKIYAKGAYEESVLMLEKMIRSKNTSRTKRDTNNLQCTLVSFASVYISRTWHSIPFYHPIIWFQNRTRKKSGLIFLLLMDMVFVLKQLHLSSLVFPIAPTCSSRISWRPCKYSQNVCH